jgi:hypothetical protein
MRKILLAIGLVLAFAACQPTQPAHTVVHFAPAQDVTTSTCPSDGTVYVSGSCTTTAMPAVAGTLVKLCSGNWECPPDYPDPGDGQPLTNCETTDYHTCEAYKPPGG